MTPPFKKEFMDRTWFLFKFYGLHKTPFSKEQWQNYLNHLWLNWKHRQPQQSPNINNHPWRTKLAHLPGEIQAIEAGMYEKDSSFDY
jgi:hypothetical protein